MPSKPSQLEPRYWESIPTRYQLLLNSDGKHRIVLVDAENPKKMRYADFKDSGEALFESREAAEKRAKEILATRARLRNI